jgi:hypothetical protein
MEIMDAYEKETHLAKMRSLVARGDEETIINESGSLPVIY